MGKRTHNDKNPENTKKYKAPANKKSWRAPKLSQLETEHTQGTTPVLPGDAGNLRS